MNEDDDRDDRDNWQEAQERRFLDLVGLLNVAADAIHERNDLRVRLAKAEADLKKWEELAMEGTRVSGGLVADFVMLATTGAITLSEDPKVRKKAKAMLERRRA